MFSELTLVIDVYNRSRTELLFTERVTTDGYTRAVEDEPETMVELKAEAEEIVEELWPPIPF